jgi:CrcB protein
MTLLLLAIAGGSGALLRFMIDGLIRARLGRRFPWGTMLINVSGSLLLGLITGFVIYHHGSSSMKLIIGTGFCGGYTTFSTASFETVRLIEDKRLKLALYNAFGGLFLTLAAAALGIWLVR